MRNHCRSFDVAVVGAGTSGNACATALKRLGINVALVDKPKLSQTELAECLSPEGCGIARQFGIAEIDQHGRLAGYISMWGNSEQSSRDAITNAKGPALLIDRALFNEQLRSAALDAGASLIPFEGSPRIQRIEDEWSVATGDREIRAKFLVDATGRSATVGRKLGSKRLVASRAVAHTVMYDAQCDANITVESCTGGWWYSACPPSGCRVATLVTDRFSHVAAERGWQDLLNSTRLVRKAIGPALRQSPMRTVSASVYQMAPFVGADWLAIGDAAFAVDPLSGSGIANAINMASEAAVAIANGSVRTFQQKWTCHFANHMAQRARFYALLAQ